ncbi:MAG: transcriptional regulator PpsR [Hyphomicrobiaceae bacterium]
MTNIAVAQPDVTLLIDTDGVIRKVTVSASLSSQGAQSLVGRRWTETVKPVSHDVVRTIIENALNSGVTGFRQVVQQFSDGTELPIEYTAVKLSPKGGLVVVGKSLQAVTELQSQLIAAQRAIEQDYWKFREIESRYRLLFDQSNEAVLLVRGTNPRITEANVAAVRTIGLGAAAPESVIGRELLPEIASSDRKLLQRMFDQASEGGHAPAVLVHLARSGDAVLIRASQIAADAGHAFMLRLAPGEPRMPEPAPNEFELVRSLIEQAADGFVIVDSKGFVRFCNAAFVDLARATTAEQIVGHPLGQWISAPGASAAVLLETLRRHKIVRLFTTVIHQDSDRVVELEISAVGDDEQQPEYFGLLIRDVSRRLSVSEVNSGAAQQTVDQMLGRAPLQEIVKVFVDDVERRCIVGALGRTRGNRTLASKLLGLSRQSLHTKIGRLTLEHQTATEADLED